MFLTQSFTCILCTCSLLEICSRDTWKPKMRGLWSLVFEILISWGSYKEIISIHYIRHFCQLIYMWGRVYGKRVKGIGKILHKMTSWQVFQDILIMCVGEEEKFQTGEACWFITHGSAFLFSHFCRVPCTLGLSHFKASFLFIKPALPARYCTNQQ